MDVFDHPDLRDPDWARTAERRARREARRARRRSALARRPRRPRSPHRKAWAGAVVVCLLAAGGIYLVDTLRPESPPGTHADQPTSGGVDLERPFLDTPAQDWPDGADGIVPPKATAVGEFTAEQVADAYEAVKQALVTSRLDERMLEEGDTEAYLALLAPSARAWAEEQFEEETWPFSVATRLDPSVSLLPVEPKVKGKMTAEAGANPGELIIRTRYTFAYAFDAPDPDQVVVPLDIVAAYRADAEFAVRQGEGWYERDQGLSLETAEVLAYSIACGPLADEGLLAPAYTEADRPGPPDGRRPPEYFDPERPIPQEANTCGGDPAGQ